MAEEKRLAEVQKTTERKRRWRLVLTWTVIALAVIGIYLLMRRFGLFEFFSSRERVKTWIEQFGIWAPLAFLVLQIA